jgi:hypothetical protein
MANKEASLLLRIKETGSEALDRAGDALKNVGQIALGVGTAIVSFGAMALKAFRESELATNQLNQAMVNSGVFSTELRTRYETLASSIQKMTTFEDDAVISSIALIQQHAKGIPVTDALVKATTDLAAAQGIDLNQAAELVGKTIGSNTNALARQGIEIDATATASEKMAQVTEALNSKFGGQAEAMALGLGSIEQLKNAFGDFMEDVGAEIAPTVGALVKIFTDLFSSMSTGMSIAQAFGVIFQSIGEGALYLKFGLNEVVMAITGGLVSATEATKAAVRGNFSQAKEIVATGLAEIKAAHIENQTALNSELQMLRDAREAGDQAALQRDEQNFLASTQRKKEIEAQNHVEKLEAQITREQELFDLQAASDEQKISKLIQMKDREIKAETDAGQKRQLLLEKQALQQLNHESMMNAKRMDAEKKINDERVAGQRDTLSKISTLSNSNNQTLAALGKAAAITQIALDTPVAIAKALTYGGPPPLNFAVAGIVGAAMAAQAARIAGVQLADGGIVRATPGGVPAIIGEGGRDEAVIPLEDGRVPGMGGNVTIIVNGGLLGDAQSAQEFAVAVDRELLKLRQSNASVAFDFGVV